MKSFWRAIGLMLLLMFVGCKEPASGSATVGQPPAVAKPLPPPAQPVVDYDALFGQVLALEDTLFAHPQDTAAMRALSLIAFDTLSGSFLVAGKGVANPRLPKASRAAARHTAALRTAERWALYLKAWRLGRQVSFGTPISGQISYSKLMREAEKNDTLLVLVQIPLGSVEVSAAK